MGFRGLGNIAAKLIAAGMLFGALGRHPYAYYTLLRWIVCGVAGFESFQAAQIKRIGWAWLLAGMALLFNPFLPVHLDREIWKLVDLAAAAILIASIVAERLSPHERKP